MDSGDAIKLDLNCSMNYLKDYQKPEDLLGQDGLLHQLTKALPHHVNGFNPFQCSLSRIKALETL
jgi:hypothetical protein